MAENDWKSRLGVVFSTDPSFSYATTEPDELVETPHPSKQKLIVKIDRRNRGGKQVTVISGFCGKSEDAQELGRLLRTKCGTGGSVKDMEIIIQGDFRDKVISVLEHLGYRAKRGN